MKLKEVITEADIIHFLELPLKIYKNDPEWIQPLNQDIEQVFDKKKNKAFRHGEAVRWLLISDKNEIIGRVAAFVNRKTSAKEAQPTGGLGFFECIDDQVAANLLFDTCVEWLKDRGMEAVDGPINFGERDRWWGLLVDGFYEPVYCMNYNPPYYKQLFENYGFSTFFEQFCYSLNVKDPVDPKFENAYHRLIASGDYHTENIKKNNLRKYASDFAEIYNKAWVKHGGGKEITIEQALSIFNKMKPVLDEEVVWFAYYKNTPVGAWLNLPELNQYFKHFKGKFGIIQKIRFLWFKMTRSSRKFFGIVFGVIPEFQGKGVDGLLIWTGAISVRSRKQYEFVELQWIGDFNPKMIKMVKSLGTKQCRTLITYRKNFEANKPVQRHKMIV